MKNNYAKISYINCDSVEYSYTICELDHIQENLFPIDIDFKDFVQEHEFKEMGYALPTINIELLKLSKWQFNKWKKEHYL